MSIDPNKFGISKSLIDAVNEALKGGQVKIDKNHNGKIDGQDFKMLRKEEEAIDEISLKTKINAYKAAAEPDASYNYGDKVHNQADRLHNRIVAKHGRAAGDHANAAAYGKAPHGDRRDNPQKSDPLTKATSSTNKMRITKSGVAHKQDQKSNAAVIKSRIGKHGKSNLPEDIEQVDELSKATLGSYIKKASHDVATKSAATGRYADRANAVKDQMKKGDYSNYQQGKKDDATADKMFNKSWKRRAGIAKATDKLTKEDVQVDEVLDTNIKKFAYLMKAKKSIKNSDPNDVKQANDIANRTIGAKRLMNKITKKKVSEGVEQVDELSKATLGSYVNKSASSLGKAGYNAGSTDGTAAKLDPHIHTINKRSAGIKRAVGKLAKEDTQIDELSTDTYHSAAKKAAKRAMGDAQGRSGPIFKKYAGMANKFRDKGMDQEKKEKASKDAKSAKMKAYRADRDKNMEEEIQIDEISKGTLASYGYKAGRQMQGNQPSDPDKFRKRTNREKGSKLAYGKYYGHKVKVPATEETDPGFAEAKTMTKVKTTKDIGYKVVDVGPGQKEKIVKAHNWTEPKKKLPNGADYAAQRRKERLAANGRMDEATENPMAKQLADKKAAIQKTIVQKKLQVMQSKANKQISSMKEGKCSCTEGKKSMTCETHGDKAMGMKGGKEPILMNPPLRD